MIHISDDEQQLKYLQVFYLDKDNPAEVLTNTDDVYETAAIFLGGLSTLANEFHITTQEFLLKLVEVLLYFEDAKIKERET